MGVRGYLQRRKLERLRAREREIESRTRALMDLERLQESIRGKQEKEWTKKEIKKELDLDIRDIKEQQRLMNIKAKIKELEKRNK